MDFHAPAVLGSSRPSAVEVAVSKSLQSPTTVEAAPEAPGAAGPEACPPWTGTDEGGLDPAAVIGMQQSFGNAFAAELITSEASKGDGERGARGGRGARPHAATPAAPVQAAPLPIRLEPTFNAHQQPQTATIPSADYFGISMYQLRPASASTRVGPDAVTLQLAIDVITPWNVQSRGRTDVPGPTSDAIDATNVWSAVRDLEPNGLGRAPRARFWSQELSTRHERFHGTDDYAWTLAQGPAILQNAVASATLPPGFGQADVAGVVMPALRALASADDGYYGGASRSGDDVAVPGEQRAYGDGRPAYAALAQGIRQRARALVLGAGRTAMADPAEQASPAAGADGAVAPDAAAPGAGESATA